VDEDFDINDLMSTKIPSPAGPLVPFSTVADLERTATFSSIQRLDGEREVQIEAEVYSTENLTTINSEVESLFRDELAAQYPDVTLETGGEFAQFEDLIIDVLRVFAIGIFLMYTILAAQFRSYTQPLLILFTVPLAFVGVVLYLYIAGIPVSITVIYAGIALVGIAVNDSIVLINFINRRREHDMTVREAVVDGARTRLRPVMLTTLTTIGALAPTAIGVGGYSVVWSPMAAVVSFGLLFSMITTLVVIPSAYGLFYGRGERRNAGGRSSR
jgi:multidrug efflux pump subunit AcrB